MPGVVSPIELAPSVPTTLLRTAHTVTVTVSRDEGPGAGMAVGFLVIAGPNAGAYSH